MEDAAAMLPDDVVLEILFRIKDVPATIFRCAMACKHWRGLVGDISFLRRCWPENTLIGFIARERRQDEKRTRGVVPAPGSGLGRGIRALSSLVPALPDGAVPLVSRHGLLLVRLDSDDPLVVQLAVCNLHIGTCHVLPPLTSRYLAKYEHEVNCYAVLTAADCSFNDDQLPQPPQSRHPSSSFFKVVIIGSHKDKYHLHTLSSHQASWMVRLDCFVQSSTTLHYDGTMGFFSDVVVRNGTAHWLFGNWLDQQAYVANLNTHTEHIFLTTLPFPLSSIPTRYTYYTSRDCLAVLAGQEDLSLLRMQQQKQTTGPLVEVWRQQAGDQQNVGGTTTSEWLCTRMTKLKLPRKETHQKGSFYSLLGEKCGTLLLTEIRQEAVYTADLETGKMRKVLDWPRGRDIKAGEVVLLEMDWAALFVSRLGGTRRSRFPLLLFVRPETAPMSRKCRRRRQEVVVASQLSRMEITT